MLHTADCYLLASVGWRCLCVDAGCDADVMLLTDGILWQLSIDCVRQGGLRRCLYLSLHSQIPLLIHHIYPSYHI